MTLNDPQSVLYCLCFHHSVRIDFTCMKLQVKIFSVAWCEVTLLLKDEMRFVVCYLLKR